MSFTEGCINIEVDVQVPGITQVKTRSTRAGEIAQAFVGQSVNSTLPDTLITSLYGLCPQAHLAAYRHALAAALHKQAEDDSPKVCYELIGEHLRSMAFDVVNAVGLTPDANVRELGTVRSLLNRELGKVHPNYQALSSSLEQAVEYFVTGTSISGFAALNSLPDFEAWMMCGKTIVSRLFVSLWESVPCRRHTAIPMIDPGVDLLHAAAWFTPDFSMQTPMIGQQAFQTGAEARHVNHPLLAEISEQYGCGVRSAFAARLIDLVEMIAESQNTSRLIKSGQVAPNTGLALVQCARGLLTYRVEVADNRIANAKIVAPTEWNFATGSIAETMLSVVEYADEAQFRRDAAWIISAIDACVPWQLKFIRQSTRN